MSALQKDEHKEKAEEQKELVITIGGCNDDNDGSTGNCKGFVEISQQHTLSDVRSLIMDDFDEDMIPDAGDFYFCVEGIRLSAKQESRRTAWELVGRTSLSIHSKRKKRKLETPGVTEERQRQQPAKRSKTVEEALVDNTVQQINNKEGEGRPAALSTTTSMESDPVGESQAEESAAKDASNTNDRGGSDDIQSTPCQLNFQGNFPYDRHNSGEATASSSEEPCAGENFDNEEVEQQDDSEPSPMNIDAPVVAEPPKETGEAALAVSSSEDFAEKEPVSSVVAQTETTDAVMTSDKDDEDEDNDENVNEDIVHVKQVSDPHKIHDQAVTGSCAVLNEIKTLLNDNPLFCSEDRRKDWTSEISEILAKSAPNVVIGVLGNTGVGKSSLLNAILEEASVLPTSGSRGCTAAVVELRFNKDLKDATKEVPVYKGEVEFIRLQEWAVELKVLVDECSTNDEKKIYARRPEDDRQPDAAAAWSKIEQVYGSGYLVRYAGRPAKVVYDRLIGDPRVRKLLTPPPGSGKPHNTIVIQEGQAEPEQAKALLQGFSNTGTRLRRTKKRWAQNFRSKINDYVYRKGNGNLPQTWPLIRKVVLEGPWAALNTGACLVDLPGVRDANTARAKVSEHYLQHCNQIWVVAPIKRAVDDGTAKELLGEQFKRQLMMDGQYGNVSFICTQTDDVEVAETMNDHQDVAILKAGRWERMTDLRDNIMAIEKDFSDLVQQKEDLTIDHEEADLAAKEAKEDLEEETGEAQADNFFQVDLEDLQKTADGKAEAASQALLLLKTWQAEHKEDMLTMQDNIRKLQRLLKSICATVRNEYSTACLREDFRAGLKELCRKPDEEDAGGAQESTTSTPLPDDHNMDVYCISANDYLKIEGIKPSSDGPPSTFSKASDTQIPSLRAFVHETTAKYRTQFTETFVNTVSDMVDRVKLLASDASNVPGGRTSRRLKSLFEIEMTILDAKLLPLSNEFRRKSETRISASLAPVLKTGAAKGQFSALSTVTSWGSKSRRTRQERAPEKNGLYWSTYMATIRRDGNYVSASAGEVNMNQELCDPMEKEFGSDWQRVLDSSIKVFLMECEAKVLVLASTVDKGVVSSFAQTGIESARLATMAGTASRSCTTALKASFQSMREVATNTQRELNRSLLPMVQARMKQGYSNATYVPGGPGKFDRMKSALQGHSSGAVHEMFGESTKELLQAIDDMIKQLESMIAATSQIITKTMESVYSVCWDDQSDKAALMDPAMQQKVRACRDTLLPDFNKLRQNHDETMRLVGIEREELELDVMEVASWETKNAEKLKAAIDNDELIDLCDSDDEELNNAPNVARMPPQPTSTVRIKADPGATPDSDYDSDDSLFNGGPVLLSNALTTASLFQKSNASTTASLFQKNVRAQLVLCDHKAATRRLIQHYSKAGYVVIVPEVSLRPTRLIRAGQLQECFSGNQITLAKILVQLGKAEQAAYAAETEAKKARGREATRKATNRVTPSSSTTKPSGRAYRRPAPTGMVKSVTSGVTRRRPSSSRPSWRPSGPSSRPSWCRPSSSTSTKPPVPARPSGSP